MSCLFGISRVRQFFKKEEGNATVESVLWFPLFIGAFGLMVDAAMIFHGQSQVLRAVQDANRNMSIGRFQTAAETHDYILNRLAPYSVHASSVSTVTAGVVRTTVQLPARDLQIVGMFSSLNDLTLTVQAEHLLEDWEA